ncbi:MAG: TetR/AcrR family transcriptional regulator [Rhodocyclaceae bacterium]|nr:TetR/AcrR family transcriptional regulator [Rhodocyclaceae bacterium]
MKCLFRRRRKEARPGELVAAALEVFVEKGFAAARLDDVAARAGVSKGTVYLYFDSKEALFKAVIEAGMTPAIEAAEALAKETGRPAAELLRRFVDGWWRMVGATALGGLPKLLVAEAGNFPDIARWFHDAMIRRAQKAMARIIEAGIARGEFRAVEPDLAARIFFAPMFSYLIWQRSFGDAMCELPPPERFFAAAVDLLIHGLAHPAAESRP